MQHQPYYSYKTYMKKTYGDALYSIPIDLDLGCPNRDIDGTGGCTFCPENGARAAQALDAKTIEDQIAKGVEFASYRYKAKKFMLYIQAYTGTFTSVMNQKQTYSKLLKLYNFDAISIGTRPDCLSPATLEYLQELNEEIDVHVDLGIQTLNDTTLNKINRGHDAACSIDAIKRLKNAGIKIFAHVIVGFEGESRKDWTNTVKTLSELNVDGIKIHNLHIIKNTQLHREYKQNPFKVYNEYQYANEVIHLIRHIPSHIPIIRISTDTPKEQLEAPVWHMQKGQFSEYVTERMVLGDLQQGDCVERKKEPALPKQNHFKLKDGSTTIWDKKYKDYYHPKAGAFTQAKELFIEQSQLKQRLEKSYVELLDIGFGMGYNTLEAIKDITKNKLNITALDKNRSIIKQSALLQDEKSKTVLESLYQDGIYQEKNCTVQLIIDDARNAITSLHKKYDIVFLDAFMHTVNPSLITKEFINEVKKVLKEDGVIICSQNIDSLKSALSLNGFTYDVCDIEKTDIKGLKVTFGESFNETLPYEDPHLVYREKQIITNREKVVS